MPRRGRPRCRVAWGVALLCFLAGGGCNRQEAGGEAPLETVEVGPGLEVDISDDPQAVKRRQDLVGLLPRDFPSELPLYLPASIVDLGKTSDGLTVVSLITPAPIATVRPALEKLLRQSGWSVSGGGARQRLERGGRRVWLRLEDGRPGTVYRFEYSPS